MKRGRNEIFINPTENEIEFDLKQHYFRVFIHLGYWLLLNEQVYLSSFRTRY